MGWEKSPPAKSRTFRTGSKYDVLEGLINITFCLGAVSWIVWKAPLVTAAVTCSLLAVSPFLAWLRQSLPKGEYFGVFPLTVSQLEDANDIAKINLGGKAIRFHLIEQAFSKNPFTTVALIDQAGTIAAYFDLFPVTKKTYQRYLEGNLLDCDLLPEVISFNPIVADSAIIFGGIATNPKTRGQRSLRQIMQVFMLTYLNSVLKACNRKTFPFAIRPKFKGEHMIVKSLGLKCCRCKVCSVIVLFAI